MFGKIFRQIFASSIANDYKVRHIFMDLIVLAESDGVLDMTHEAIAGITRIPIDDIRQAIDVLEKPDPQSRSREYDGSRLIRLTENRDWGWKIVNYERYRVIRSDSDRKEYMRRYMRIRRSKSKDSMPVNNELTRVNHVNSSPSTSTSSVQGNGGMGEGVDCTPPMEPLPGFPKSEEEAIATVMTAGVPDDFARSTWNIAMSRGGRDARGVAITSWIHHVKAAFAMHQSREAEFRARQGSGYKPREVETPDQRFVRKILENGGLPI